MYEASEFEHLIYNEPTSYVELLLSKRIEKYLKTSADYTLL